jgi:uncharacterized protein (DUF3820 family)
VNNDDFGEKITLKPYLKYVYQPAKKGPKTAEKEAFLKAINSSSNHLYGENLFKKRGYYLFYKKKGNLNFYKEQKQVDSLLELTLQLSKEGLKEVLKKKSVRGKRF